MLFLLLLHQSIFSGLEADEDEDFEIGQMTDNYKEQGGTIIGESSPPLPPHLTIIQENLEKYPELF